MFVGFEDRHLGQCCCDQEEAQKGCASISTSYILNYSFEYRTYLCITYVHLCVQAFCEPGNVKENGVLAFAQHVLFPILEGRGESFLNRADVKVTTVSGYKLFLVDFEDGRH